MRRPRKPKPAIEFFLGTEKTDKDKDEAPKITLEILDSSGKVIRKYPKKEEPADDEEEDFFSRGGNAGSLPADAGFDRFVWDLGMKAPPRSSCTALGRRHRRAGGAAWHVSGRLTVLGKNVHRAAGDQSPIRGCRQFPRKIWPSNSICC